MEEPPQGPPSAGELREQLVALQRLLDRAGETLGHRGFPVPPDLGSADRVRVMDSVGEAWTLTERLLWAIGLDEPQTGS